MCSITINKEAENVALNQHDMDMIKKRMIAFAMDSSIEKPGVLDIAPMKRMPEALRDVKKQTIGRHRVYYTGHHTQCCFNIFYVKVFKRKGVNDEDDKAFQRIITAARNDRSTRLLN